MTIPSDILIAPAGMIIRDAVPADTPFIAQSVLTALTLMDFDDILSDAQRRYLASLSDVCTLPDTLYHWSHTRVAMMDERTIGCLVAYDGGGYVAWRNRTFSLIAERTGHVIRPEALETEPGEYYLDTMAIIPSYRGRNIGRCLMLDAIAHGRQQGFSRFGLVVDITHPRVRDYYASLGFIPSVILHIFGTDFLKMTLSD